MLPGDDVPIETTWMSDISFVKSMNTKKQLEEFVTFQNCQGTRKTFGGNSRIMAYCGRNEIGEWGWPWEVKLSQP
jgi:hypothetical protein